MHPGVRKSAHRVRVRVRTFVIRWTRHRADASSGGVVPEAPEVERAAARLRGALAGRRLRAAIALHPAQRRTLGDAAAASLAGRTVTAVERRGKHQLLHLDDGRVLHVHFRMSGDWTLDRADDPLPRHARVALTCEDGTRAVLIDPRALAGVALLAGGAPLPVLGPEADDPVLTPALLRATLARRRGPIKPALLDQRLLAGVGNIYAAEALWHARIDPRAAAASLGPVRVARLLQGVRTALAAGAASAARYGDDAEGAALMVYGREGEPCPRCGGPVRRIAQAGRSTYFCGRCQR